MSNEYARELSRAVGLANQFMKNGMPFNSACFKARDIKNIAIEDIQDGMKARLRNIKDRSFRRVRLSTNIVKGKAYVRI